MVQRVPQVAPVARFLAEVHEPWRDPGAWQRSHCSSRLAHGRGDVQRCPVPQAWDDLAQLESVALWLVHYSRAVGAAPAVRVRAEALTHCRAAR